MGCWSSGDNSVIVCRYGAMLDLLEHAVFYFFFELGVPAGTRCCIIIIIVIIIIKDCFSRHLDTPSYQFRVEHGVGIRRRKSNDGWNLMTNST